MFLDDSYGYKAIQKFASEISSIDTNEKEFLEEHFHDDKSNDFYLGLMTGYANSYSLIKENVKLAEFEKVISFLADKIAKRGL
jgi:hypothetical protein